MSTLSSSRKIMRMQKKIKANASFALRKSPHAIYNFNSGSVLQELSIKKTNTAQSLFLLQHTSIVPS